MKILATADWHFHGYKAHSYIRDGINSRLDDIRKSWVETVAIGVKERCKAMTISGDLFHVRGMLKPSVINVVQWCVAEAVKAGMKVVIIPGNHDMESYRGGATAVDFLEAMEGVHILNSGELSIIQDVKFGGIPYQHSISDFISAAELMVKVQKPDVVLIHQGIDDFKPTESMPDFGLSLAKVQEIFGSIPVFCGHYHKPMKSPGAGMVYQVGAPVQHNFSDEGQSRGFWIFDTETGSCVPHPIDKAPSFITIEDGDTSEMGFRKGAFVRIRTTDPDRAIKLAKKLKGGAGDIVVVCRKEFKADDSRATIEAGPVVNMLIQYVEATPELKEHGKAMVELYNEVCG